MSLIDWCYLLFQAGLIICTAWIYHRIGREDERKKAVPVAPTSASVAPPSSPAPEQTHSSLVANLLVLVWKLGKKPDDLNARSVLRATERVMAVGEKSGFQLRTYQGTRLLPGSRVQVVDTVLGPDGLVVEDLEPEVLLDGSLVRPAAVTVGKGS